MKFNLIYPKNPQVIELIKNTTKRSLPLEKIKGEKGHCKWCTVKIPNTRKKYCSDDCKKSAWAFFYPQKYSHSILMARQKDCCNGCGYNFKDETKKFTRKEKMRTYNFELKKMEIKSIYTNTYTDWGDVDHVIPISQGGESLGVDNHQLLCKDCHRKKTAMDLKKDMLS